MKDLQYALLSILFLVFSKTSPMILEVLLWLTRPLSTILLLGTILYSYNKGLLYTSIMSAITSSVLLKDMWTTWPRSDSRRLYLEQKRDQARFDPMKSVDLQVANGDLSFDSPNMLHQPKNRELLVFPPSNEVLAEMCG